MKLNNTLLNHLVSLVVPSLSKEIWAKKDGIFQIMEPIAEKIEIKLKWVKKLKTLEEAKKYMFKFFKSNQGIKKYGKGNY